MEQAKSTSKEKMQYTEAAGHSMSLHWNYNTNCNTIIVS